MEGFLQEVTSLMNLNNLALTEKRRKFSRSRLNKWLQFKNILCRVLTGSTELLDDKFQARRIRVGAGEVKWGPVMDFYLSQ